MIRGEHGIQCMPCSSLIVSEMLPEILTSKTCNFLKPIIYSQIIYLIVVSEFTEFTKKKKKKKKKKSRSR